MGYIIVVLLLVFVVPSLPYVFRREFRRELERHEPKAKARFTRAVRPGPNGRQTLTEDDLAELEGMFGEAGSDPADYK